MTDRSYVNNSVTTVAERSAKVRPLVARAVQQQGLRAAARTMEVSYTAVANFVAGSTPQEAILARYEKWADQLGGAVVDQDRESTIDLMEHFEGMVRRMGGADVAPEELRLRKLDVVEGLTRLYGAAGGVPGWVYDLKGRIQKGEI